MNHARVPWARSPTQIILWPIEPFLISWSPPIAVELVLETSEDGQIIPLLDGRPLADPTPLASLPGLEVLQANPFTRARPSTAPWAAMPCGVGNRIKSGR
ncbi:MAG: hypothetical protein L0332_06385 [Chloroflexi bacterium]|nr:hypothetical protein [Chloroflexota bacterium]MCI0646533.1 hypothetical protein [Chloroflexota bacterium]MCI0726335.1 hypothetical protein [Chloroflexota bacterium]